MVKFSLEFVIKEISVKYKYILRQILLMNSSFPYILLPIVIRINFPVVGQWSFVYAMF